MGFDRLEACLSEREGHAETLSEGNTGRQLAQGESLATDADPLIQCESAGSQASDREPRQENGWCRRRAVGHTTDQGCGHCPIEEAAVSTLATTEGLHSKIEWEGTPTGNPDHARQGHASVASAGSRSGVGIGERSEFVWIQERALYRRCNGTDLQTDVPESLGAVDFRCGHCWLFRQHQSSMD